MAISQLGTMMSNPGAQVHGIVVLLQLFAGLAGCAFPHVPTPCPVTGSSSCWGHGCLAAARLRVPPAMGKLGERRTLPAISRPRENRLVLGAAPGTQHGNMLLLWKNPRNAEPGGDTRWHGSLSPAFQSLQAGSLPGPGRPRKTARRRREVTFSGASGGAAVHRVSILGSPFQLG